MMALWFQFQIRLDETQSIWNWIGDDMQKHIAAWELLAQFSLNSQHLVVIAQNQGASGLSSGNWQQRGWCSLCHGTDYDQSTCSHLGTMLHFHVEISILSTYFAYPWALQCAGRWTEPLQAAPVDTSGSWWKNYHSLERIALLFWHSSDPEWSKVAVTFKQSTAWQKSCCSQQTWCLHRFVCGEFILRLVDCR